MLEAIAAGRTDLVHEFIAQGSPANTRDANGVSLIQWCAYYGDVSAILFLIGKGESLASLGENHGLGDAAFHGHWQLCEYLIGRGADVNFTLPATGETPLHLALCTTNRIVYDLVVRVLLGHGAKADVATKPSVPTQSFMRDCRTKGETPLHRAAAFGTVETIELLLNAGARRQAKDMNGDSPLTWASWYLRPPEILRALCYDGFSVREDYGVGMQANRLGRPLRKPPA